MSAATAAVLRFSSLGDVLLAAHLPSFLRRADPARRVLFVTKERHAHALRGHPDIDRLYMLQDSKAAPTAPSPFGFRGGLSDLVAALRIEGVGELYDAHGTFRSSRVLSAFPAATRVVAGKHAIRRRLWVHARWLRPRPVPPILETYRALAGLPVGAPLRPWLREALSPEERRRAEALSPGGAPFVLLSVGARWRTKRWPLRHFAELARSIERELGLAARFVSGYLYDEMLVGDGALVGGGATHAWLQVFLPGAGWVEFDPTNALVGGHNLIRVAVARDPSQAIPLAGSYKGEKEDFVSMSVEVTVTSAHGLPPGTQPTAPPATRAAGVFSAVD